MKSRTCQRFGSPCSRRWTQSIQATALALQVSTFLGFFFPLDSPPLCFSTGTDSLISPPSVSVQQGVGGGGMMIRLLEALLWLDASCFLRVVLSWRRCFHCRILWQSSYAIIFQLGCVVRFKLDNKASTKVNRLPLVVIANQNSSLLAYLTSYPQRRQVEESSEMYNVSVDVVQKQKQRTVNLTDFCLLTLQTCCIW